MEKKCYQAIRDGFPQLSWEQKELVGPPPVGNGDLVVFWPILGLGHLEEGEIPGPGQKQKNAISWC